MLSMLNRTLVRGLLGLALVSVAVAVASAPADAFTTTAYTGRPGAREVQNAYPNQCYSKNWYSGQFLTALVWVNRSPDSRYVNSNQFIGAAVTLKKYNPTTRTWAVVKIDGNSSTFLGWHETEPGSGGSDLSASQVLPLNIFNLSPGTYRVQFEYWWWVSGVGYIAYAKDDFNNDVYRRQFGESVNGAPPSTTSIGSCYVD